MITNINDTILKSHTSIVGMVCKDGVVLAADRRVTAGHLLMNKNYRKIFRVTDYLLAAYTGTVSDQQLAQKVISAELKLKELRTKTRPAIKEAAHLFAMMSYRNIRVPAMIPNIVGALLAGVDENGKAALYSIMPDGVVDEVQDYDANVSSGMPFILGLLERTYKKDLTVKEGVELAKECLKSSTQRDIGSGNGIDIFTLTRDGIKHVVSEEIVPLFK